MSVARLLGSRIRVVLADDHPVVLAGMSSLLQAAPEIELVGEAEDGVAALELIQEHRPDVAVIDISMPGMNGVEVARRVSEACPSVRVIALTVHEDRAYVEPLLRAGARGYLLKRSAAEDLVRAVRSVAGGGMVLDPAVADKALVERAPRIENAGASACLSPREADVLRFASQGFGNKEIATRLKVSVKTVETYKARASEKLHLRSRAAIVRFGAAQGWLEALTRPAP